MFNRKDPLQDRHDLRRLLELDPKNPASNPSSIHNRGLGQSPAKPQNKKEIETNLRERLYKERDFEIASEEEKLRREREQLRLNKEENEAAYAEKLRLLEEKKEEEIRRRVEKEEIRNKLTQLETNSLNFLKLDKVHELEQLNAQREMMKKKEDDLMKEITNVERNIVELKKIRNEEQERVNKVGTGLREQIRTNKRVDEKLLEDKFRNLANLQEKRERLELAKDSIAQDLEKLKRGELPDKRGGGLPNPLIRGANSILGEVKSLQNYNIPAYKQKVEEANQRIQTMKDAHGRAAEEMMSFQSAENMIGNKSYEFPQQAAKYLNQFNDQGMNNEDRAQKYGMIREEVEKLRRSGPGQPNFGETHPQPAREKSFKNDPEASRMDQRLNMSPDPNSKPNHFSTPQFPLLQNSGGYDQGINYNNNSRVQEYQSNPMPNYLTFGANPVNQSQKDIPLFAYNDPTASNVRDLRTQIASDQRAINGILSAPQIHQLAHMNPNQPFGDQTRMFQPANSIGDFLNKKMAENDELRSAIGRLKMGDISAVPPEYMSIFTNPMFQPSPETEEELFDIFKKNDYISNKTRNVQLSQEQRIIIYLHSLQTDYMRALGRIPVGTEMYKKYTDKFKEIASTRSEISNMTREIELQRFRWRYEQKRRNEEMKWENEKWVDDLRKKIIAHRIKRDLYPDQEEEEEQGYDPRKGFMVYWDYLLGIPQREPYSKRIFGVNCLGETLLGAQIKGPVETSMETATTNRCIYNDSDRITNIPVNHESLLIWEVQLPYDKVNPEYGNLGWTMIDLFDSVTGELKRGRWKCPLYELPTDLSITKAGVKDLEPIPGAWFYLRIAYPGEDEFGQVDNNMPESHHLYEIPEIHLREYKPPKPPTPPTPSESSEEEPPPPPPKPKKKPPPKKPPTPPEFPVWEEPQPLPKPLPPPPAPKKQNELDPALDDKIWRGLKVTFKGIKNHVAASHLKVQFTLFEDSNIVIDQNGKPLTFFSTVHNPLDLTQGQNQSIDKSMMSNKAVNQDIIYNEEFKFLRNLIRMHGLNKKSIWLEIKVLEKPEPKKVQEKSNASNFSILASGNDNFGNMEFELKGWWMYQLNSEQEGLGNLKKAKEPWRKHQDFPNELVFLKPIRPPPLDETKVVKHDLMSLNFEVEDLIYDKFDLDEAHTGKKISMKKRRELARSQINASMSSRNKKNG